MNHHTITPEPDQLKLWYLAWYITFLFVMIPFLTLTIILPYPPKLVMGIFSLIGIIVFIFTRWWIPKFFQSLEYILEDDAIKAKGGVFWKKIITVPYSKITNIDLTQGPVQRIFKIGTVHLQTAGAGGNTAVRAELLMVGIRNLEETKNLIMENIKSRSVEKKEDNTEMTKEVMLMKILQELTLVRQLFEKKN